LIIVEVLKYKYNASPVKLTILSRQKTNISKDIIEILASHIFLKVVQKILSPKGSAELNNKRKSHRAHDFPLLIDELLHLIFLEQRFTYSLYSIIILMAVSNHINASKLTIWNFIHVGQLLKLNFLSLFLQRVLKIRNQLFFIFFNFLNDFFESWTSNSLKKYCIWNLS